MAKSPYAEVGPGLVQLGYSAIPILPGSKAPGHYGKFKEGRWDRLDKWTEFCHRLPSGEDVARWASWPRAGVGVCLGVASGLVALDFDTRPDLWPQIEAIVPRSPVIKRGEKGYTAFYRFNGERSRSWEDRTTEKSIIDLLSTGSQTIIPPTIHPTTQKPYTWDNDRSLLEFGHDDLPTLPEGIAERIDAILGTGPRAREQNAPAYDDGDIPSLEMLERALSYLYPGCGYRAWVSYGMAIHWAHPGADGLAVWDRWSRQHEKYDQGPPPSYHWRSFTRGKGITAATLFDAAKLAGFHEWDYDVERALEGVSADLDEPSLASTSPSAPPASFVIPNDLIDRTPGLVGRITRWIVETAKRPQPVLALGAALTAVGVLKGHRYRTETDLRSNLYILGLAQSGAGKNHPVQAIQKLFADAGCDGLLGGEPGSEPGLCEMIRNSFGRSLLVWDEMGEAVAAMLNPNSGTHYSQILTAFTRLFSEANSFHQGKVLAAGSRENIEQPCLCVFGVSVPEPLFDSMTARHAINGFLPRWLLFQVQSNRPPRNRSAGIIRTPSDIVLDVRRLGARPEVLDDNEPGGLPQIRSRVVPFTMEAREMFEIAEEEFDHQAETAELRREPTISVWARAAEHAAKLALVVSDGDCIGEDEIQWALDLVWFQAKMMCEAILSRVGQNTTERNVKKVLMIIREAGPEGITGTELNRKTQWLSPKDRETILETLTDAEQISILAGERKGRGPRSRKIRAI